MTKERTQLKQALNGDINAFQHLFSHFQGQLKSYMYRLTADRLDSEDLTHDTFVRAFDKIATYKGDSSLKTWVFQIGTNLAYDLLKRRKRWAIDAQDMSKQLAISSIEIQEEFHSVHNNSLYGSYEIKEHIDFCFTCISKSLVLEQQVALILKDVYDFSVADISRIMNQSTGVVKHLLNDSRKTMMNIYDNRCALVGKNGACNQCSELQGYFNPKQNRQEVLLSLEMVRSSEKYDKEELYELRKALIKTIDPLRSNGAELQEVIMKCTRKAIGELS